MKKFIGYLVLSTPIILLFIVCAYFNGIKVAAIIISGSVILVGLIALTTVIGCKILDGKL